MGARLISAAAVLLLLWGSAPARASEVSVTYLVDARELRNLAWLSGVLTFELYADTACREPLHREQVSALRVAVSRARVRPASSGRAYVPSRAARLETTLILDLAHRVASLIVRGEGVRPVGPACQAQGDAL